MKPFHVVLLFFLGGFYSIHAQPLSAMGWESALTLGKLIRHTPSFPREMTGYGFRWEAAAFVQTDGSRPWHSLQGYPEIGLGLAYSHYGAERLGACISLYPSLQFPLITFGKWSWTIRLGFGIGYATKPYERYPSWDTFNTAIGSHINNYTLFSTDLRYPWTEKWELFLGADFSHISNASLRRPNLGMNMAGIHAGFRYQPKKPLRQQRPISDLPNSRILAQVRLGLAATEMGPPDGPLYLNYLVSAYASKRYAGKNKILLGLDYSYHDQIYAFLRNNEIHPGEEKAQSWKSSLFIGHEFLLGRVGIVTQLGFYLRQAALPDPIIYQKLGGHVYIVQREIGLFKEVFASCLLKAHMADAELVEMGLGMGF